MNPINAYVTLPWASDAHAGHSPFHSQPSSQGTIFKGQTAFYCYCAYALQWLPSPHRTQSCQGARMGSVPHQSLVGCQVTLQACIIGPSASVSTWAWVPPSAQPESHLATPTVDGASS